MATATTSIPLTTTPPDDSTTWEWIYAPSPSLPTPPTSSKASPSPTNHDRQTRPKASQPSIIAARKGDFVVHIGDIVALKAERNDTWVAIVTAFSDEHEAFSDEEGGSGDDEQALQKSATFQWFSSLREIRDKSKRLPSTWPNELYITPSEDVNPLETIEGKATVLSSALFREKYPTGKVPKASAEFGKVFVCRRGCNTRNVVYTEEIVWEELYKSADDLEKLKKFVGEETSLKKGKKASQVVAERGTKRKDGDEDFVAREEEHEPKTPRKRQRFTDGGATPKSTTKRTPSQYLTPTHKRIITKRPLEFTPLGTRRLFLPNQDTPSKSAAAQSPFQTPHSQARTNLHVSALPAALPCRESEFEQISNTLATHISSSTGTCLYISGTPGTGKTATVREVIASLYAAVKEEELDDFIFVEINGLKVADPHQSYALLWEALMGERVAPGQALGLLEREFARPSPRRVPCVVLMDELDQLVTKNQEVMYNFFNWPTLAHSRLIVLAVANTMDLPERTLSNKISSRLGLTRITFQGYTHAQLMKIIESRLASVQGRAGSQVVVEPDAIQFASRKVAQVSGDARRALDMCRRAVEIAEREMEGDPQTPSKRKGDVRGRVTIATIQKAIREATSTPLQQYLRHLPLASKVFLAALLALTRRTGIGEATIGDVVVEAKKLGSMSESPGMKKWLLHVPSAGTLREAPRVLGMGAAASILYEAGVIVTEERKGERWSRVRLQVGEEEIKGALRDDEEVGGLGFKS